MGTRFLALGLTLLGAQTLGAQTKLSGAGTCAKPDVAHTIAIGDRPNHSFTISQTRCRWTKPFAIAGLRSKGGTAVQSDELSDSTSQFHGYFLDIMSEGNQAYYRYVGTTAALLLDVTGLVVDVRNVRQQAPEGERSRAELGVV